MIDTLLSTVIAVSALLALVLLTRRPVARHFGAQAAYALWLLPLGRLLMPSFQLPSSWLPKLTAATTTPPAMPSTVWRVIPSATDASPAFVQSQQPDIIWPLLTTIWIVGIIVGIFWSVRSQYMQARHLRQTTMPLPEHLISDVARAARLAGLSKAPTVKLSLQSDGPLVCGVLRPVIVLPKDFTTQFTPTQQRLALLHEMTHLRRGDLWAATAMWVFRLASWPNPLIHWAWPRFRADQEAACDASVLRRVGETARADYAETLLTAAKTTGRATPVPGAGLSLSLHHPIKERLMILGTKKNSRRGTARWALAALLLTGTAISAPLSFADDQTDPKSPPPDSKTTISTTTTKAFFVSDDDLSKSKGFEIINKDGAKTYLRVSRDGTTENLTREEMVAEYGADFEEIVDGSKFPQIEGEPGLNALSGNSPKDVQVQKFFLRKNLDADAGNIEIIVEDGDKHAYRVDEDGTKTEIDLDDLSADVKIDFDKSSGAHILRLPDGSDPSSQIVLESVKDMQVWVDSDTESHSFSFGTGGAGRTGEPEARMRSAQFMIESTDKIIEGLRDADGDTDKDLREAARELEKARKALEKAMEAVRKSDKR